MKYVRNVLNIVTVRPEGMLTTPCQTAISIGVTKFPITAIAPSWNKVENGLKQLEKSALFAKWPNDLVTQ